MSLLSRWEKNFNNRHRTFGIDVIGLLGFTTHENQYQGLRWLKSPLRAGIVLFSANITVRRMKNSKAAQARAAEIGAKMMFESGKYGLMIIEGQSDYADVYLFSSQKFCDESDGFNSRRRTSDATSMVVRHEKGVGIIAF